MFRLRHHRFGDPNPSEVDNNFQRLEERFALNAQDSKRKGLRCLRERFMRQRLNTEYLEAHHRVLSLLYWLQGQPLRSEFDRSGLEAIERRAAHIPGTQAAEERLRKELAEDMSDFSVEEGAFASGSELSDWGSEAASDGEDPPQPEPPAPCDPRAEEVAAAPDLAEGMAWLRGPALSEQRRAPHPGPGYTGSCLLSALSRVRTGGPPSRLVPASACAAEYELLREALQLLRGIPGRLMRFGGDGGGGSFSLADGAHTPDLSCAATRSLLEDFITAGNRMLRARRMVASALVGSAGATAPRVAATPTLSALCVRVEELLEECCAAALPIEAALEERLKGSDRKQAPEAVPTLLQARAALKGSFETLAILDEVLSSALPSEACGAAECSASLLSALYEMLVQRNLEGEPHEQAVLLSLLASAMEPYLGALQAWLVRGAVDEQWDEFFVVKSGRSVPVHSPEYWASCFVLRGAESGGVPARQPPVPSFLSEVADGILSAGKAVHLMSRLDSSGDEDALPAEEIRRSAPTGPAAQRLKAPLIGGEDGALFRAFCDSVRALAGEHGGGPGEGPKPAPPPAVQRLGSCVARFVEGPEPLPPVSDDSLWWSWPPRKAHPAGLPHRRGDGSSDRESRSGDVTEPFEGDAGVSLPGAASLVSVAAYTGGAGHHGRRPFARRDQPPRSAPLSLPPRAVACLPPPSVLVDRCLLRPISRQVEAADRDLLERLLGPWGLMSELRLLRGVFLMGSSALEPFSVELFETVGESPGMLSRVPAFQVEAMLKTMVPRVIGEGASNLDQSRITVDLDSSACGTDAAEAARRGVPHINELLALQVKYRARAPLRMVLDDTVLDAYSAALVFLLQVRWARHAVDRCRMALFRRLRRDKLRATSGARQRLRLLDSRHVFASLQEMMHFATNLQQYVTDRNLFSSWSELEQAIDAASSIDDVIQEHKLYMKKVQTHCLLLKEKYVRFMQDGVLHTLNHLLQWCKVVQRQAESDAVSEETTHSLEDPQTEMYRLKSEYDRSHRYLLKILHAIKDSQTGAYYGLEHLLMRLEYNRPS